MKYLTIFLLFISIQSCRIEKGEITSMKTFLYYASKARDLDNYDIAKNLTDELIIHLNSDIDLYLESNSIGTFKQSRYLLVIKQWTDVISEDMKLTNDEKIKLIRYLKNQAIPIEKKIRLG